MHNNSHSSKILHAKIGPLSIVSNVAMHEVQLTSNQTSFRWSMWQKSVITFNLLRKLQG